jgi:uncharacterized small protein (DUF1192 family)
MSSSAEPVFYLGDSDESEDAGDDVGVMHERRPLHQRRASVSRQAAVPQRVRSSNSRSKASVTRSLWELEDRCAQLESEVERAAAERELMTRKLIWLEESVRTLVGMSSRTSRIYWDWGKRDGSAAAAAAAAYLDEQYANPRPRSQYEHAPRRDHAFNRQRLPPPPPPIATNGVPMPNGFHGDDEPPRAHDDDDELDAIINDDDDDVAAASALADAADLAARVGAFLTDSNRLLAQHGIAVADSARVDDDEQQNEDEFEALRSQVMLERNLLSQMHATRRQRQNAARRR